MRVETPDFVFEGTLELASPETVNTSAGPLPVTPEAKALRKPNEISRLAAAASYRIRTTQPDPARWRPMIEALDPELRDCAREYLAQEYRAMQRRRRLEQEGGKRSAAGDEAMAELAKRYGGVK